MTENIFDYVLSEEKSYQTRGVTVADGYEWQMSDHIKKCILYKDGKRLAEDGDDVPVKNIILPILNVNYRLEGFDVKNIFLYADDKDNYHKSLLIRKFYDKYAIEKHLDTLIDDSVMSYIDFGIAIAKKVKGAPEFIPPQKIAFCDQTDFLSGPFAIKHQYSIDQLKEKSGTWNEEAINEVVEAARMSKPSEQAQGKENKTPGKYIEVYEVHGVFPKAWLTGNTEDYTEMDESSYSRQIHIISYKIDKQSDRKDGVTLFKGPEKDGLFKVLKRDKRFGTACGRSAIEELIEAQVWNTYSYIQQKLMMDKLALMLGVTDDPTFASKNKITELEQGEWLVKQANTSVEPFVFPAGNLTPFTNFAIDMENHARITGSASDAPLGISPTSGTPFKLQDLVVNQNEGIHLFRQGQIASFWQEIHTDWIIPELVAEMNNGQKFLTELSLDELEEVSTAMTTNFVNNIIKKNNLNGRVLSVEEVALLTQKVKEDFKKQGPKRFAEILKGELSSIPVGIKINIAGKQKDLASYVDKLSNIFRQVFANPAILQDPNAVKFLNAILEGSGISPIDFKLAAPVAPAQPVVSPMQENLTTKQ